MALAAVYYLLGALAVTLWLWRDPASRVVAGNPNDADQLAWFFRYDATAIAHGHLPALITTAMNAPQGVSVMWNTFMMLPGTLLAPVTWLAGPQAALTVFMTAGFAGSALAMFVILRRWGGGSVAAAALGGAVYGFSPAVVHSAIGHYDLQFAVLPPLIIDIGLRLATGRVERAVTARRRLAGPAGDRAAVHHRGDPGRHGHRRASSWWPCSRPAARGRCRARSGGWRPAWASRPRRDAR